ncbi:signal-induced proliferation-associated 1 like 3, partial [Cladochytrium replicatum]
KVTKRYKFGILYCKSGQTTEDEMFGNEHGSPSFANFLRVLGEQVSLKDFKGFAAGLDCKNGQTGGHTVWSLWRNYECTFHVSTMLPYNADDPQQIQRKRHIGNDLVCVVFLDGNGSAFDPLCIHSQFLHVFIVVSEEARETMDELDSPVYRVTVTSNLEVPTFGPPLPSPPLFYNAYTLREFIFAKSKYFSSSRLCIMIKNGISSDQRRECSV